MTKAEYMRKWRATEQGKKYTEAYNKSDKRAAVLQKHAASGKRKEAIKKYYQTHKDELYAKVKLYREAYKERKRASDIAQYHHTEQQLCSVVGCGARGERHHPDYTKPQEILWLCKKHHRLMHIS